MTPYVFAGLAILHHNPQTKVPGKDLFDQPFANAGEWTDLMPLGTEGQFADLLPTDANFGLKPYKLFQPAIPLGAGIRWKLNESINLLAEVTVWYLFTDYLDDVSHNYVDLGVLESDLAKSLSYRGNELGSLNNRHVYVGRDGNTYAVEAGFGSEHPSNLRGNRFDNDVLFCFSVGASMVLSRLHKAKRR